MTRQKVINIAAYKFTRLIDLREMRDRLLGLCKGWELKGTILLSPEGINLFIAGGRENIDRLLAELRTYKGLEDLQVKESETDHQPFTRMLVRLKKEIIAFGVEGIDPATRTSPKLPARTLKQWLDEGRPVTLLDTRNDYEVKLGTFRNALPIGIDHFRDFPSAVRKLPAELKEQPIVMFCTGGIRCEKAGPFMEREGFQQIFQLEGGILKYFEECHGAHYDGECFVFDQRVGVDPTLHETESTQCYHCQTPLTEEEQQDRRYIPGKSCPYCFKTSAEQIALQIADRQKAINRAVNPLPGSAPYDNYRPIHIPENCDQQPLLTALCEVVKHIGPDEWQQECERGHILDWEKNPAEATRIVRAGERYVRKLPQTVEPAVNGDIRILHEDEALILIDKPAPLPMHPGGRFHRNTLQYILQQAYYPQKPRPAHRLDANTTGLVLIARTRHFAGKLQPQFADGTVEKQYLVRVQGTPAWETHTCEAPISTEPGEIGSRRIDWEHGIAACTRFEVLERKPDGTALLVAIPVTGRTNQIRLHAAHLGLPVLGDTAYLGGETLGEEMTLPVGAPPLCLHAWKLRFRHPLTGEMQEFTAPKPAWAS